jgi:hypothetical protein
MHTLAIHLIWTTYLTWPPGDPRGHWSALFDMYGKLMKPGRRLNLPDPATYARSMKLAKEPPKVLSPREMALCADVIGDHIAAGLPAVGQQAANAPARVPGYVGRYVTTPLKYPPPQCVAAAIEPTHVHLLIGPCEEDISAFAGRIKGRSSSELGRIPENAGRKRVWTEGYWNVFLFDEEAVRTVKDYVEDHNRRRGLPSAPFTWVAGI